MKTFTGLQLDLVENNDWRTVIVFLLLLVLLPGTIETSSCNRRYLGILLNIFPTYFLISHLPKTTEVKVTLVNWPAAVWETLMKWDQGMGLGGNKRWTSPKADIQLWWTQVLDSSGKTYLQYISSLPPTGITYGCHCLPFSYLFFLFYSAFLRGMSRVITAKIWDFADSLAELLRKK